jgi:hypothetical protein
MYSGDKTDILRSTGSDYSDGKYYTLKIYLKLYVHVREISTR